MTSEVLMLNKDAVVIAADSAVTIGQAPHPRYSKAANKIFDISMHGNVAVTIFAASEVDSIPWELLLKQYRRETSGQQQLPKLEDYVESLMLYLQHNPRFFPQIMLDGKLRDRFYLAASRVLERAGEVSPDFVDEAKSAPERAAAWANSHLTLTAEWAQLGLQAPLAQSDFQALVVQHAQLTQDIAPHIEGIPKYRYADAAQLVSLAIEHLFKKPMEFLVNTGLVFAGYGNDEIFPSYVHIEVYGHVGSTLLWRRVNSYSMTHENQALILPFAQSSMIDRFTDGFDTTLNEIIHHGSRASFNAIVADFVAAGAAIPAEVASGIIESRHQEFMSAWRSKNWDVNFHPLRRVLNSLSVPEMGHLAESLLVLEELRERVTSPSESVGGPIDVVAITKSEGLLWLKRKHFFDPQLNQRYLGRIKADYN